ncbi:hypothetical protein N7402_00720 [Pseudomonas aeruginosa]|uniref:hypothetical protein n=1 Tax=Pseudomonas aeruginosa TaxID=287 RepID=UPI00244D09DA|nr:hypothetical protein [Pseudomonas aeruginosa]MDH0373904.1 hypothetical protein [Pseudomonas aeruginosa]
MKSEVVAAAGSQLVELVGQPSMEPMTRMEVLLIQCYRRLSDQDRRALMRFAEALAATAAPG